MSSKFINEKITWALKPEVKQMHDEMVKEGIDPDLALTILEQYLDDIYDFEGEDVK